MSKEDSVGEANKTVVKCVACNVVIPPARVECLDPGEPSRCKECQVKLEQAGKAPRIRLPANSQGVVAISPDEVEAMRPARWKSPD